jgi:uncharacterized membrane protein YhaH (DUF805 family)
MFRMFCNVLSEIALCIAWLFLWPDGRISRRAYVLGCIFLTTVWVFVLWSAEPEPIKAMQTQNKIGKESLALLLMGTAWTFMALYAKRLHDCGLGVWSILTEPWTTWVHVLRILEPIFPILMLFWPGDKTQNKYGDPTSILRGIRNEVRR